MRIFLTVVLLVCSLLVNAAQADEIADITGQWRTVRHGALVQIIDCGDATPCGTLMWVSDSIAQGNTTDARNRNASLRNRPLIGVPVLWDFESANDGWRGGSLYNPDDGKTFSARLNLVSDTELQVTGCIGPLCRSQIWTRISSN